VRAWWSAMVQSVSATNMRWPDSNLLQQEEEESGRYLRRQAAVPERAKEKGVPTGRRKHAKSSSQTKSGPPLTMEVMLAWCRRERAIGRFVNNVVKGKERYVDTEASQPHSLQTWELGPEPAVPAS
jgi:hypothetical protein